MYVMETNTWPLTWFNYPEISGSGRHGLFGVGWPCRVQRDVNDKPYKEGLSSTRTRKVAARETRVGVPVWPLPPGQCHCPCLSDMCPLSLSPNNARLSLGLCIGPRVRPVLNKLKINQIWKHFIYKKDILHRNDVDNNCWEWQNVTHDHGWEGNVSLVRWLSFLRRNLRCLTGILYFKKRGILEFLS